MTAYSNIRLHYKIWMSFSDERQIIDDNGWLLLCRIEEKGNLKLAAESMGISYRKAWGDLRKTEQMLRIRLTEKHRGGEHGGTTVLTSEGEKIVKAYRKLLLRFQDAVNDIIIEFKRTLKDKELE